MNGYWDALVLAHVKGASETRRQAYELSGFWRPDRATRAAIKHGDEKCEPNAYGRLAYTDAAEHGLHVLGLMFRDHDDAMMGPATGRGPTTYWRRA